MESPDVYIPMDRRQAMVNNETLPSRTNGAALIADISGFTSLTAAMVEALGPKHGASEATRQLNLIYEALIPKVHRYRGSVIGFGGDAITCWFDGDDGLRATGCALEMQQVMSRVAEIQTLSGTTISMAIKVGIAAGAAHRFLVGDPQIQFLDVLAGATLDRMAIAEKEATRGEAVLDPLVADYLSEKVQVAEWRQVAETGDRLAVISALAEGVNPEKIPWPDLATQDGTSSLTEAQIRPWLLPPVYDRLAAGRGAFLAELRTTVTLFLRFEGIDYDLDIAARDKLDAYIRWVQNTLARHEGYLIKLTIGDKGSYLLATFGAPLAHGDDAARAVAAALELQTLSSTIEFITGTQIGLTQGRMLAGAFGSSTRSAYDVLGSEANLAARLMTKAESGQILISKRVAEAAGKEFRFNYLAKVDIKGWHEPIPVFEVSDRRVTTPQRPTFLVGRENALNQLEQILNLVSAGQGQLLRIEGVAGVGKSHLTADLIELVTNRNFQVAQAACQNRDSVNVYGPWRHIFRTWFDLTDEPLAGEDPAAWTARQVAQVEAVIEDINPDWLSLLPILGDLLDLQVSDNETSMIVDPVLRQGVLFALAIEMVKTWAKNQPSLILIDDAHWLDEASRRLSRAIGRSIAKIPLLLAFVHRSPSPEQHPLLPELDSLPHYNHLNLHGTSEPVEVHRPHGEGQQTIHLQLQKKIIGRTAERKMLAEQLYALLSGEQGSLTVIEGEAGIGKSRLVSHVLEQAQALGVTSLVGAGTAIGNPTPYHGWRPVFSQLFDLDARPGAKTTIKRIRALSFLPADPELLRLVPLLNAVLPLGLQENDVTSQMTGQVRTDNTNELLVRLLQAAVDQTPTLLVLEDAQWLDSASWMLTHLVCQRVKPVLFILVTRPRMDPLPREYQALLEVPGTQRMRLKALPAEDIAKLVCQRLGVVSLPNPLEAFIRRKAEGHPFFSEELAYTLRDAGLVQIAEGECQLASHVEDLDTIEIPDIIEGVIISRIDRLTPAHQLTLKVASVIGTEFSLAALQAVHPIEEDKPQLTSHLKAIERLDITRLETPEPELAYVFKTNLIQEVVYDLLPTPQQQDLHRAVAEWYERSYGDDVTPLYPLLAYHYERAGDLKTTINYLWKAGENAVKLGGFYDALNSLHHALDLLQTMPENGDMIEQELNILITLGSALIALKGWGAPEVKRNYDRAWALCRRNGPTPQLVRVLFGLSTHHFFRGELRAAQELVNECLKLANKLHHATLAVEAHLSLANIYFWLGNFTKNLYHYQQVIRLYDPSQNHTRAILYAQNPRLTCLMCSTWALCIMGYPEQALTQSQEVLTLAESLNHPLSGATAVQIGAWLHQQRREFKETQLLAEQLLELTPKTEFPLYRSMGLALYGWALAHQERTAEGIAKIKAGIAILDELGTQLGSTFGAMLLAEAYQQAGLVDKGLAVVSEALTDVEKREEASYAAELYRLQGELLLATSAAQSDAEAAFTKALNIARQQQARLFELRAVIGLSRIWQQQGKFIEAHSLLAVTYNQFTEGSSTPDLQSAAEFLAELSA